MARGLCSDGFYTSNVLIPDHLICHAIDILYQEPVILSVLFGCGLHPVSTEGETYFPSSSIRNYRNLAQVKELKPKGSTNYQTP